MAYNFALDIPKLLITASDSATDIKKRYTGIVIWLSENLQRDRDYAWDDGFECISWFGNESVGWDVPKRLYLNNEEDYMVLKLKFLI